MYSWCARKKATQSRLPACHSPNAETEREREGDWTRRSVARPLSDALGPRRVGGERIHVSADLRVVPARLKFRTKFRRRFRFGERKKTRLNSADDGDVCWRDASSAGRAGSRLLPSEVSLSLSLRPNRARVTTGSREKAAEFPALKAQSGTFRWFWRGEKVVSHDFLFDTRCVGRCRRRAQRAETRRCGAWPRPA